jgi:hypothetical protein
MSQSRLLLCVTLAASTLATLQSQAQCPGNIHSLHAEFVQRSQILVPVRINGSGPWDFLVDTGNLITMVDPALAAELALRPTTSIGVVAVTQAQRAAIQVVDSISVEEHSIQQPLLITHELSQLQASNPRIRGILGQNFLAHFDLLMDYQHKLLCLDETGQLQQSLAGEHLPLVEPRTRETDFPFAQPLIIQAHLTASSRQILLRLDSGSNMPLLYDGDQDSVSWIQKQPSLTGRVVGNSNQSFAATPTQDIYFGSHALTQVTFVTPLKSTHSRSMHGEDGLLPTSLLRRIFISYNNRFIILSPKG